MSSATDLIKAIRGGSLRAVVAALEAGAPVELHDGKGDPGLPLAVACFLGQPDIIRALVRHGARVNVADNAAPTSPLAMAIRGGKRAAVQTLVELGARVPDGIATGLSEQEFTLARWTALQAGLASDNSDGRPLPVVEEIQVAGCYGTDTAILEEEALRAALAAGEKKDRG